MFLLKQGSIDLGNLLITRGFKTFIKEAAAMSRPQQTSCDTCHKLLKSAEQEFALQGYDKASLRQICAHAGVTTGALYFDNKETLLRML